VKRILGVMLVSMAGVGTTTAIAAAQVGYPPSRSPFVDVEQTQELTALFGWFNAKRDPARVAPKAAMMTGLQYEWRATGPLHLGLEVVGINSERNVLDPQQPAATRDLGTQSNRIYGADGFLAVSLTGARSWHHVMPMTQIGMGFVSDFKGPDVGGFKFGTRFALPWGAGVRWVPGGGHIQLRADVKDWMYTVVYPQSYFTVNTVGGTAIVTGGVPASGRFWTNNFAMTVGLSYIFSH
jgi:hypothetical protein